MFRYGRGWSASELADHLSDFRSRSTNFAALAFHEMREDRGWAAERATWNIGWEAPGLPEDDGLFERVCAAVERYEFSDPDIVRGHFDPHEPLLGRTMVLQLEALGGRLLCGVRVSKVDRSERNGSSCWGYRYDTLHGHVERGAEWFRVTKSHRTGEVRFCIESRWKMGDFDNPWTRVAFERLAPYYRSLWMKRAAVRLRSLGGGSPLLLTPRARWSTVAGLGALTGARTMAGPVTAARIVMQTGTRLDASLPERAWARPVLTGFTCIAALGEAMADKHPRIPSRLEAPALLARIISAGVSAAIVARSWGRPASGPALVAGCAALASAGLATHTRRFIARRFGLPSAALGLLEDAVVVWGSSVLTRRSVAATPKLVEFKPGPDLAPHARGGHPRPPVR